eukprot:6204808-Pleurochrysis_carterae.AAC.2
MQACTASRGREMGSTGELTLDVSGSSGGWSENLDLAPTRRSCGTRPPWSPLRSRGPSASLWVGEIDLRCFLLCASDLDWCCSSGSGVLDRRGGSLRRESSWRSAPRRGASRRRSARREASSRVFHALNNGRLAPISPVVPRGVANLGGGGMFRGRVRPRLSELDASSPALAIVDEWRVTFDFCD